MAFGVHHKVRNSLPRGTLPKPRPRQPLWLNKMTNTGGRRINQLATSLTNSFNKMHLLIAEQRSTRANSAQISCEAAMV